MLNVFEKCPVYETKSFIFRLVELADAEALLSCYSDKENTKRFNADYCTSDFYYATVEEMIQCIQFWLDEYRKKYYVRFALISKLENHAIGTVEIFGGDFGVLRIDLAQKYDTEENFVEIVHLAIDAFSDDFGIGSIKIKTSNISDRIECLEKLGFILSKSFRNDLGYHEYNN